MIKILIIVGLLFVGINDSKAEQICTGSGATGSPSTVCGAALSIHVDADPNPPFTGTWGGLVVRGLSVQANGNQNYECIRTWQGGGGYAHKSGETSIGSAQCVDVTCTAGDNQSTRTFEILNGAYGATSVCSGGCMLTRSKITGFYEDVDQNGVVVAEYVEGIYAENGAECPVDSGPSGAPTTATSGNPKDDTGQECTGDWYTNSSGGISCGSPDSGGGGDPDPVTPDNSCISNPTSCTDTDGDGTPDTPTACTVAGSNCTDTNGDGRPDTPSDTGQPDGETGGDGDSGLGGDSSTCSGGANSDGSCNGDGDVNTVPDGKGSECRPETTTYDGKCPSGSNTDDCPSKTYTLVGGVSVCSDHAGTPTDGGDGDGEGTGTASGGETCDSQPTCDGDPIGCASLQQQWKLRCDSNLPSQAELHEAAGTTDVTAAALYGDDIFDLSEGFDKSGYIAGGACPASYNIDAFGKTIPIDLSIFCSIAEIIGVLVLIAGALHSTAIVVRAF